MKEKQKNCSESCKRKSDKIGEEEIDELFTNFIIADDEMRKAIERTGKKKKLLKKFGLLVPSVIFGTFAVALYRSHSIELLKRLEKRKDLVLATKAEILCVLYFENNTPKKLEGKKEKLYRLLFHSIFSGAKLKIEDKKVKKLFRRMKEEYKEAWRK